MKLFRSGFTVKSILVGLMLAIGITALSFGALKSQRSPLAVRKTPGGVYIITDDSQTTGNVWFVNSGGGAQASDTAGYGTNPDAPFLTLNYAISQCTASNGDRIYLMPGHAETISAAAAAPGTAGVGFQANIAGIDIFGLGSGRLRPTFTYTTATTAAATVSAAQVHFKNCVFINNFDAVVAMITITANDCWFENCEFVTNNATMGVVQCLVTAATADRFKVTGSRFLGPATNSGTTTTAQIDHEVGVDFEISGCYFTGKCTQNILNATTNLRGLIDNNRFVTATGTKSIAMAAASTPMITNNRFNVPSGTAPVVCAAGFMAGNVYSAAAGVTAGTASTF